MRITVLMLAIALIAPLAQAQDFSLPPKLKPEPDPEFRTRLESDESGTPEAAIGVRKEDAQRKHVMTLLEEIASLRKGEYGEVEKILEEVQLHRIRALMDLDDANSSSDPDSSSNYDRAAVVRTSIWRSTVIPVSWENPSPGNETERKWVQAAIKATWERESGLRFTGWGASTTNSPGIRIRIADAGPHCKALGRRLNGMRDGMVLNFTFNNWCRECASNLKNSIQWIAVHEFGHALGFAHEHNRFDAPACEEPQGTDPDWYLTIYDPNSVMNYCNPKWNNHGRLSPLDVRAVRTLYGNPPSAAKLPPFSRRAIDDADEADVDFKIEPQPKQAKESAAKPSNEQHRNTVILPKSKLAEPESAKTQVPSRKGPCPFCKVQLQDE